MNTFSTKQQKEQPKSFKLKWNIKDSVLDIKLMNFITTRREKR